MAALGVLVSWHYWEFNALEISCQTPYKPRLCWFDWLDIFGKPACSKPVSEHAGGCGVPRLVLANRCAALGANHTWRPVLFGLTMRVSASGQDNAVFSWMLSALAEYI